MLIRCDRFEIDETAADHFGDAGAKYRKSDEIKERGPENGNAGAQNARGNNGRDRVRGVVHPIRVIEYQCDRNNENDQSCNGFHILD